MDMLDDELLRFWQGLNQCVHAYGLNSVKKRPQIKPYK